MVKTSATPPSLASPVHGGQCIGDPIAIEDAITERLIAAGRPKSESGVDVTLIGDSNFETIIVTQTCLPSKLQWPKALNDRFLVETKGGLEECVHTVSGWRAKVTRSPCCCSLLCRILVVSAGISKDKHKWEAREA